MSELSPDKRGALREKISELLRTLSIEDGDVDEVTDGLVMVIESTVKATLEAVQALASTPSHVARKPDERDHAILKAVLTERAQAIALAHRLTTTEGYGACTTGGIRILCEALLRVDEALLAVPSLSETFAASTTRLIGDPNTPTPRTDEEVEIAKTFPATNHGLWVSAEFARQLEREAQALYEKVGELERAQAFAASATPCIAATAKERAAAWDALPKCQCSGDPSDCHGYYNCKRKRCEGNCMPPGWVHWNCPTHGPGSSDAVRATDGTAEAKS